MSDPNEAIDEALTEVVTESIDKNKDSATVDDRVGSWAWLLAGFAAAIVCYGVAQVALAEFQIPLPEVYEEMTQNAPNGASTPEMDAMELANREANRGHFLFAIGASLAFVFGWAGGFIHRRIVGGIIGAVIGLAVAYAIGMFAGPSIVELSQSATSDVANGDMLTIALHSVQWLLIGIPIAIAITIAVGRPVSGLKVLGAVALAAVLAGVLYMLGGTLLDPGARIAQAYPQKGNTFYLWTCLPPILLGVFLSRVRL